MNILLSYQSRVLWVIIFSSIHKYFKITAIFNFLSTICFNVNGMFCRRRQFVLKSTAYVVAPLA